MTNHLSLSTLFALGTAFCTVACGGQQPPRMPEPPTESITTVTAAEQPTQPVSPGVSVSEDILRECRLNLDSIERAPKFEFDRSELLASDMRVLDRIAECATTGPLQGRRLQLIGRTDPRGSEAYNHQLGARRAGNVAEYLGRAGIAQARLETSSRGELDAKGTDEVTWALDRRVDVLLAD